MQRLEITSVTSVMSDSIQQLFEQAGMSVSNRLQSAFGILTTVPLRSLQPPVSLKFLVCFNFCHSMSNGFCAYIFGLMIYILQHLFIFR